jgi:hypothetical protein
VKGPSVLGDRLPLYLLKPSACHHLEKGHGRHQRVCVPSGFLCRLDFRQDIFSFCQGSQTMDCQQHWTLEHADTPAGSTRN